jgi:WD40 repeat protein
MSALVGIALIASLQTALEVSPGRGDAGAAPPAPALAKYTPRRLEGHDGGVFSLAFSPDGKFLIAGGKTGPTVPVWDLVGGKLQYELPRGEESGQGLPRHEGVVRGVAYSPDSKLIATVTGPHPTKNPELARIVLWDAKTGKPISEIAAHRGRLNAVAFSPDSKRLVSGGGDDMGKVWDVASGRLLQQFVLDSRSDEVVTVAFLPDGKSVFVASRKGEWLQGDVESGRRVLGSGPLAEGKLLRVTASGKEVLCLYGNSNGYVVRSYSLPGLKAAERWHQSGPAHGALNLYRASASPDGKALALFESRGVSVWSLVTGRELLLLYPERGPALNVLAFSPDGKTLAGGLESSTSILLWDISRPRLEALWDRLAVSSDTDAKDYVTDLAALPDEALPYLSERLQRLAKVEEQVRKIASKLDDDDFDLREKASQQLKALGHDADFGVERVLEKNPPAEVRRRLETAFAPPTPPPVDPKKLSKTEYALWLQGKWPPKKPEAPKPSQARAAKRAIVALEKTGTPEARQALKTLAASTPEGLVREEASAALKRLAEPKSPRP